MSETISSDCQAGMVELSHLLARPFAAKTKGIVGGELDAHFIATTCCVKHGLDEVSFYVLNPSGLLIGVGSSKGAALQSARWTRSVLGAGGIASLVEQLRSEVAAREADKARVKDEWRNARVSKRAATPIPARRRQLFDEAGGVCHYCRCELTLEGEWEIEHKMPRALKGNSKRENLTVACIPCNRKKRDKTDLEFKAELAAERA